MNSSSIRLKSLAIVVVTAAAAVPVSFLLWRTPAGAAPPPDLLPLLLPVAVGMPSIALGMGIAFLLFGGPLLAGAGSPALSRAAYLGIAWLLMSWWPHSNFHRVASGWTSILLVDYVFHTTAIAATGVVAVFFLSLARQRRPAAGRPTGERDLASARTN